jgi:dTDP-4-amino-4,6-dideoxygalactose transaminase
MFRNPGMVRSLPASHHTRKMIEEANPLVDPRFLFALPGTNLRPSDVHASFGLRDVKRAELSRAHRIKRYGQFYRQLDPIRYYLPPLSDTHVAFCLPVFTKWDNLEVVKRVLTEMGAEIRPIIGGNLLHQPPFQAYGDAKAYPNAEWLHKRGVYVGLHAGVTPKMITRLTDRLNTL